MSEKDYNDFIPQIQKSLLLLIDELYRVSNKLNLHPYMLGGTLLGAVRHNGFIPWDDDADFGLKRNEMNILLENRNELSDFCYLEEFTSEHDNKVPWCKLRLRNTLFLEKANEKLNLPSEMFIDIIPIDNAPSTLKEQKRQQKRLHLIEILLFSRINKDMDYKHRMIGIISHLIPVTNNYFKRKYTKVSSAYNKVENGLIRISSNSYRYFNDIFDLRLIQKTREYSFAGRKLISFYDYDTYLTQLYGDYMTPPPLELRVNTTHNIIALNFDTVNLENIKF